MDKVKSVFEQTDYKHYASLCAITIIVALEVFIIYHQNISYKNETSIMDKKYFSVNENQVLNNSYIKHISENNIQHGVLFPFHTPFRLVVSGPSQSGKTEFVRQLIHWYEQMIRPPPKEITWFYAVYQPWFQKANPIIKFKEGIPSIDQLSQTRNQLIVIDDMFQHVNENTVELFTKDSHHQDISVVFITQNFFHQSRHQRNITLNASYLVLLKNPRDKLQISYLARQMFPHNPTFLIKAYEDATRNPYSYLLIDWTQEVAEDLRIRTNIFPGEFPRIYQPTHK